MLFESFKPLNVCVPGSVPSLGYCLCECSSCVCMRLLRVLQVYCTAQKHASRCYATLPVCGVGLDSRPALLSVFNLVCLRVILWVMFYWKTLGHVIHVDVTSPQKTFLNIIAQQDTISYRI